MQHHASENDIVVTSLTTETIDARIEARFAAMLDPFERAQMEKFKFDQDRCAYVAAHGLLRHSLSARTGYNSGSWRFALSPGGKPFVEEPAAASAIRFSLSHTRTMVAVAIADGYDIGVDVEACGCSNTIDLNIAEKYFTSSEITLLRELSELESKNQIFLELWTLKEAVVKATGLGLSQSLDSFSIAFDPLRVIKQDNAHETLQWFGRESWSLRHWLHRDHHISVAAHGQRVKPRFHLQEADIELIQLNSLLSGN